MLVLHVVEILTPDKNIVDHIVKNVVIDIFLARIYRFHELVKVKNALLFVIFTTQCLNNLLALVSKALENKLLHVLFLNRVVVIIYLFIAAKVKAVLADQLLKAIQCCSNIDGQVLVIHKLSLVWLLYEISRHQLSL